MLFFNRSFLFALVTLFVLSACDTENSPANTAPVATDASVSLLPGGSITDTLAASDVDGDSLTISIVTNASNGSLTLDDATTGDYTYIHGGTPDGDSFTFKGNDGLLDSNIATVQVTTVIPAIPAEVVATAGNTQVTLNWDAVDGADSYNVYWTHEQFSGTSGTQISDASAPFVHGALINGSFYYYVVTAVNAVGESAASLEVVAVPRTSGMVCSSDRMICPGGVEVSRDPTNSCAFCPCPQPNVLAAPCGSTPDIIVPQ